MLINTKTNQEFTEVYFRSMFPDTSFPQIITDEVLLGTDYRVINEVSQPVVSVLQLAVKDGVECVNDMWQYKFSVIDKSATQIQNEQAAFIGQVIAIVQNSLDEFAKTKGYDGILSGCTYATSLVTKFKTEGQRCVDLRDQTWSALYLIQEEFNNGTKVLPDSPDGVLALLPPLTW